MVVVLFRSRLTPEAGADYSQMAAEMLDTAKTMPGFVDFKSFKAEDGERISVVWWQDQETLAAWRSHARHRIAQKNGRESGTNITKSRSPRWFAPLTLSVRLGRDKLDSCSLSAKNRSANI